MALAILRLDDDPGTGFGVEQGRSGPVLVADTGTSTHYRIHLGTEVRDDEGFRRLDAPYWSSPLQANPKAGQHIDTAVRVQLDPGIVTETGTLVQLETSRGPDGRGPAWSRPLRLPWAGVLPAGRGPLARRQGLTMAHSSSLSTTSSTELVLARSLALEPARTIPCRSAEDTFSRPASIGDLIGQVVQAAAPLVLNLLNQSSPPTAGAAGGASPATGASAGSVLTDILRTVLGALAHTPAAAAAVTPPAPVVAASAPAHAATPVGTATTASTAVVEVNRFVPYARPMIFGIDDALIGAIAGPVLGQVVGPVVQMLPQLLNAMNQQKLAKQALTNQQVQQLLSEVDRSTLMQQLINAQNQPPTPGAAPDPNLAAVGALLAAQPTAPAPVGTAAAPAAPAVATTASLDPDTRPSPIASKAVLSMVVGPAITRLGKPQVVFGREHTPTFRFRLDVGVDGPRTPLPRAILDLCVREPGGAHDLVRRTERLTDVTPGTPVAVALTAAEAASLPSDADLEVLARLRWPGQRGSYQATCSQPVVIGSSVMVRERGAVTGDAVELTDMARYRSFWNKVWSTDAADRLWGLDLTVRYSVVATASEHGNGLMEAKLQDAPDHSDSLRTVVRGRLKSGLEVATSELAKLLPLWPGQQGIAPTDLAALSAPGCLAGYGGDVVTHVAFDGKRRTGGQLWVVPVLRLRSFTLSTLSETDSSGQAVATTDRTVSFPVIESVRFLGLSSHRNDDGGDDSPTDEKQPTYRFEGYDVVLNQLVGLEPAAPAPATGR